MTLRQRLLATTLVVAVPLTIVLYFVAGRYRHADMFDSIERHLARELSDGLLARCEADGGPRPPPRGGRGGAPRGGGVGPIELIPYTRNFESLGRGPGPAFPDELKAEVDSTAHDVATPLTVLQGHLATLELAGLAPANAETVYGAIREAHYMASLLRNLTTASRLEGGVPLEPVRLDLNVVIDRVLARLTPLARAAGVEVNFAVPEGGTFVEADPTLVEQAISNLVDNAVRYNTLGGHVAVVLDRTDAPGGFRLTVEDDGPGVKPEELAHLATRRFRGDDARSRKPDGQGIGLAITAEAISRCGWTLSFRANEPSGLVAEIVTTAR